MLRAGRGGGGWRVGSYYWVKFRYGNTKEYYSTTSGLEEFRHQISKELKASNCFKFYQSIIYAEGPVHG